MFQTRFNGSTVCNGLLEEKKSGKIFSENIFVVSSNVNVTVMCVLIDSIAYEFERVDEERKMIG